VINPVGSPFYGYAVNSKLPADPSAWDASAEKHDGSWWPDWLAWIKPTSGEQVPARVPGSRKLPVIEDAPGSYVKVRY
jgi:polyhydroxyalkanoate synthase